MQMLEDPAELRKMPSYSWDVVERNNLWGSEEIPEEEKNIFKKGGQCCGMARNVMARIVGIVCSLVVLLYGIGAASGGDTVELGDRKIEVG